MEIIHKNLEKITDAWNFYFWEYKYCQSQINFTNNAKTNYFGDILSYFTDTLDSLASIQYEKGIKKSVFQSTGILQIIYVHQDLIDELLYIFKLPSSLKEDKNPNRNIRNELIGHPIRRKPKTKEFISSSFFSHGFSEGTIHYVLYSRQNNFSGTTHIYELDTIIKEHFTFLQKYTKLILNQIEKILRKLQKKLVELNNIVRNGIPFPSLVTLVMQIYPKFEKEDYLFEKEILIRCYERQTEHPRYKNAVTLYLRTLKKYLPEIIKNIDELFGQPKKQQTKDFGPITIKYVDNKVEDDIKTEPRYISYEFSKLFERHPIFGVEYFKVKFKKDKKIMTELNNMSENISDTLEYYCSCEYLRKLLIRRKFLKQ